VSAARPVLAQVSDGGADAGALTSRAAAAGVAEIVVTAPRDPTASGKAIETKRDLGVISDGVSGTEVAALPELGLGDALAAIPGVTFVINNGRGEDQFMTVRGLNPDYNTVTIDGMPLPSTEETVRSLSFDVFPAFLISQASVYKTWTVDQPTDAIGAVTNLQTRSAFDHRGSYLAGQLDGGYWDRPQELRSNTPSGEGSLVGSRTFGSSDQFGILGMVSYYRRSSNTLNTTTSNFAYYPTTLVLTPDNCGNRAPDQESARRHSSAREDGPAPQTGRLRDLLHRRRDRGLDHRWLGLAGNNIPLENRDVAAFGNGQPPGALGAVAQIVELELLTKLPRRGSDDGVFAGVVVWRPPKNVHGDLLLGNSIELVRKGAIADIGQEVSQSWGLLEMSTS
jgi:hypothetical protein